jgi:MSHA biogenesis protein MshP
MSQNSFGRQRGIGIVTAIFLLVVLAALGVAMVSIFTAQQATSALDVMGARGYLAARAGAEWGVHRQRIGGACEPSVSFPLAPDSSLSAFTVTVACTQVNQPGIDIDRFRVVATACNQPTVAGACPNPSTSPDYIQRVVDIRFGE